MFRFTTRRWNGVVLTLLGLLFMAGPLLGQPHKINRTKQMGFADMLPENPGDWVQVSVMTPEEMPELLDINEIYQVLYAHPRHGQVALTLEYTSDSRREFELHYPDVCHAVRGDGIVSYPPGRIHLSDSHFIDAALMSWEQRNSEFRALTAYWYVARDGITTDSMKLKVQQALAGLFSRPEELVMVRFDAFYEEALSHRKRTDLFAAIKALNRDIEDTLDTKVSTTFYKHLNKEDI